MTTNTYATNITTQMIANMSQFQSSSTGANVGVGYVGWDSAFSYARDNNLDYFASVFLIGGDAIDGRAFMTTLWNWHYLVRIFVKTDMKESAEVDSAILATVDEFMDMMTDTAAIAAISPSLSAKVRSTITAIEPYTINDVKYLTVEFLIDVPEQIT